MANTYDTAIAKQQAPSLSVVKQTAFTSARDAFNDVLRLENRIDTIVNSLVGYPMQATGSGENPAEPDSRGIFDSLSKQAGHATESISRAHAALDRLEREF